MDSNSTGCTFYDHNALTDDTNGFSADGKGGSGPRGAGGADDEADEDVDEGDR